MNSNIPDPARGGDILPWAQGVTDVCRRFGGVGTSGMLVREGPGGVGCEPIPQNRRERRAAAPSALPWSFRCTVAADADGEETRAGGWHFAALQVGLNCAVAGFSPSDPDRAPDEACDIKGVTQTADGVYYCEVDLARETAALKRVPPGSAVPPNDYKNNTVNVYVGTVENAVQTKRIHSVPCVYKRLD